MFSRTRALIIGSLTAGLFALLASPAAIGIDVASLVVETPPV